MNDIKTIRVFIDTEFTDFINCDLISLGAVASTGEEFYAENSEYYKNMASAWVRENIIPTLNFGKFGMRRLELSARFWCWLIELEADEIIITSDHSIDIDILKELFRNDKHPKIVSFEVIPQIISRESSAIAAHLGIMGNSFILANTHFQKCVDSYFVANAESRHNALSDARAIKFAWFEICNKFGIM
jgi:hypothetical protein